ncbi:MAG TPA: glucose-1-phosphate thymidylyltransferase, partial [Thermoplasmata archaeon]|nr:glucose-1-phosphate thymidylyltransferase [Thermoplasmata archaeon]
MKGLLLAGGHGTRLRPLTFSGNKHMIPIANQPMLFYGLRHLAEAGIRDVGVILGPVHEGIEEAVGDGAAFGLRVTYIHQGDPRGLADAVRCARDFLADDPFVMYLGDNLLQQGALPFVRLFEREAPAAVVGATPVADPRSYGVVELDERGEIASIAEKPAHPKSSLALIGVYLFTPSIHDVVARLRPSARGEYEITDAIWELHRTGARVAVQRVEGWWKDTGRPEDLLEANERILRSLPVDRLRSEGTIEPGAVVHGAVAVGAGSVVRAGATLEGPSVIGSDCEIGPGSVVGPVAAL